MLNVYRREELQSTKIITAGKQSHSAEREKEVAAIPSSTWSKGITKISSLSAEIPQPLKICPGVGQTGVLTSSSGTDFQGKIFYGLQQEEEKNHTHFTNADLGHYFYNHSD